MYLNITSSLLYVFSFEREILRKNYRLIVVVCFCLLIVTFRFENTSVKLAVSRFFSLKKRALENSSFHNRCLLCLLIVILRFSKALQLRL